MTSVRQNLIDRHLDLHLHPVIIDEAEGTATFYIWNLSGCLLGYQQYRPSVKEKKTNDPKSSRYFTYSRGGSLLMWGLESFYLRNDVLFITEGIFDACRLTALGYPAVALLTCHPPKDTKNWFSCLPFRRVIAICDKDENGSGKKLAKFGSESYFLDSKDLGDATDVEVEDLLCRVGVL